MFEPCYEINRENVKKAVRRRLESDAMQEIMANTFRDYCVFFIAGTLVTLNEKTKMSKEQLLEVQKELSSNFSKMIRASEDGNSVDREKAMKYLEDETGIVYDEQEDKFE